MGGAGSEGMDSTHLSSGKETVDMDCALWFGMP